MFNKDRTIATFCLILEVFKEQIYLSQIIMETYSKQIQVMRQELKNIR